MDEGDYSATAVECDTHSVWGPQFCSQPYYQWLTKEFIISNSLAIRIHVIYMYVYIYR